MGYSLEEVEEEELVLLCRWEGKKEEGGKGEEGGRKGGRKGGIIMLLGIHFHLVINSDRCNVTSIHIFLVPNNIHCIPFLDGSYGGGGGSGALPCSSPSSSCESEKPTTERNNYHVATSQNVGYQLIVLMESSWARAHTNGWLE